MPSPYTPEPEDLSPYTTPPLQQRVSQAINALRNVFAPAPPAARPVVKTDPSDATPPQARAQDEPAGRGLPDANLIASMYRQYQDGMDATLTRRRRYAESDLMDNGQMAAYLDAIIDACLISDDGKIKGVKIQAGNKIESVLNGIIKDTNLNANLRLFLRDTLKYGDNWIGYVFDDQYNIVAFDNPPPHQMWTFGDRNLRLYNGTETIGSETFARAYQQKTDALKTVAAWFPFEMAQLKYRPSLRKLYSERSFLDEMRADWYKLRLIEEGLVLHRVTRAAPRLIHTLDVTGKDTNAAGEALKAYIDMLHSKRTSNDELNRDIMAVDEDYFLTTQYRPVGDKLFPSLNNVTQLDPRNTGLAALPDVDYLQQKMYARVPPEIVGILPDRQDISTQDIAASRFYAYLQFVLETQFLRPMFNLGLMLKGFVPKEDDYQIIFPDVQLRTSWRFADANFRQSLSNANDVEAGINNRKNISQDKYGWTDAEWDAHVAQFKKEQDVFAPPEPAPAVGKNVGATASKTKQMRKGQNST